MGYSMLDQIADHICDIEVSDDDAEKLQLLMTEFATKYHRTYRDLMRIAGFRKIWDALFEMSHFNTPIDQETEERIREKIAGFK